MDRVCVLLRHFACNKSFTSERVNWIFDSGILITLSFVSQNVPSKAINIKVHFLIVA